MMWLDNTVTIKNTQGSASQKSSYDLSPVNYTFVGLGDEIDCELMKLLQTDYN
jgi:hypothetical protein